MYWKEILYYLTFPALIFLSWILILSVLKRYEKKGTHTTEFGPERSGD